MRCTITRGANLPAVFATAIFVAVGFGLGKVWAQQPPAHDFQQGTTERGFSYMAGGVGSAEREQMSQQSDRYNLKLVFAEDVGVYLADVRVRIKDASGQEVGDVISGGPWFFVQLPPGRYDVEASFNGRTKRIDNLQLARGQTVSRTLRWDVPVEPATVEFAQREQSDQTR